MELFKLFGSIFINDKEANQALDGVENKAKSVGEKLGNMGGKMVSAGTVMTGAISGVSGLLINMASDNENASAKMKAQLGLTAEETQKLGAIAKDVWGNNFGQNMGEVTQALTTVKQNIKGVNDADLSTLTKSAFTLQSVFGADITDSTKTASTMMKNFGIDGQHAMDLMTVGFQKGGNYSGELLDSMNEYAPQFKTMGFSADDMMNILVKGAQAGAFNLDKVGDAVKEFNIRAKDGSKTTSEGFKAIGLDADQMGKAIAAGGEQGKNAYNATIAALASMKDPVAQNAAGVALFGTQWEDLSKNVITAMGTGVNALGQIDGATKQAQGALDDTFGARMTAMWRDAQTALQPLAESLMKLATEWMPKLLAVVEPILNFFTNLPAPVQGIILSIVGLLAVIAPLLIIFGSIVSAVGTLLPLFASLGGAGAILGTVFTFLTGPIGIAIAIIAALIAIGVLLYKNWDEIKAFCEIIWEQIKQVFVTSMNAINDVIKAVWDGIKIATSAIWDGIKAYFELVFGFYKTIFTTAFDEISKVVTVVWDAIKTATEFVWNGIKAFFDTVFGTIKTVFQTAWDGFKLVITTVWDAIKTATEFVWNGIKTFIENFLNGLKTIFDTIFNAIKTVIETVWNAIKTVTSTIWNAISGVVTGVWDGIKTGISTVINGIRTTLETAFNGIKDMSSRIWNGFKDTVLGVWDGLKSGIKTSINFIINGINAMIRGMNKIHIDIPKWAGGGSFGVNIPTIPLLAKGGTVLKGGSAIVGEAGAELIDLPAGARVTPLTNSQKAIGSNESKIEHVINFQNVPNGINTEELKVALIKVLGDKKVQREIDYVNQQNYVGKQRRVGGEA